MSGRPSHTPTIAVARAILAKDLRIELRTLESIPAMALFSLSTFVVFRFALDRTQLSGSLAAGVIVATLLFAGLLGVNRLFAAERADDGFDQLRLAPVDASALFAAKVCALMVYLAALDLVALPAFGLFFDPGWAGLAAALGVMLGLQLAIALTGAVVAAMTAHARAREVLTPLILLPLLIPAVIAAAEAASPLLDAGGVSTGDVGRWALILGLYDLIFCLVGWATYDFLLED